MEKASLIHSIKAAKLPMLSINLCNPKSQWKADSRSWRYGCVSEHEENTNPIRKISDLQKDFI